MGHLSDLSGYKKSTLPGRAHISQLIDSHKHSGSPADSSDIPLRRSSPKTRKSDILIHPAGINFIDYRRKIWGDSFGWASLRPLPSVKYLVIHHSATPPDATPDVIAEIHKKRGWLGIGYHFVITGEGKVWYVGDLGTARANVENMNSSVVGICLVGDFTKILPTGAQILAGHKLCDHFLFHYPAMSGLGGWQSVVGHKDLGNTACPGTCWGSGNADAMENRIRSGM